MRKASIPFALCALLIVAPLVGCNKIQARAELKKGNKFYKEEAYKDALTQFQRGLQLDPAATFAWRSVGLASMALFKPGVTSAENTKYADLAVDAFQKYLKEYPQDRKVEEYLVGMWVNSGQYDKAIAYLKQQRLNQPENTKLNGAIVNVMIKASRFKDALDFVDNYGRRDPQLYYTIETQAWSRSYNDPTVTLEDRKQVVDLGLQAAQKAVDARPDYMEAMVYYNLLYREKAKLTLDPKEQDALKAKADEWRDKALAIRERQKAAGTKPLPAPAK
ncbi:MAG: tetratricopeptide repeat protein [Acidobacteriota bacterium]